MNDPVSERSKGRVRERIATDADCIGPDGNLLCPFCEQPLDVRRTILGRLDMLPDGTRPHIDGVQLKCAGDDGCGFRPDFDVPIPRDEWEEELEARNGERVYDVGYEPGTGESLEERLKSLGYIPE